MKKMKNQSVNNKLAFNKSAVTELNDSIMTNVHGGSEISCAIAISISLYIAVKEVIRFVEDQNK